MILEFMCVVCFYRFILVLIFQYIIFLDAENPMNHTATSIYLNIHDDHHHHQSNTNVTCPTKYCHNEGQCVVVENHLKCL